MKAFSYQLIRDKLEDYITQNGLKEGGRLPGEVEMARLFGVSRPTLRECIKMLQKDGMIVTRVGSGNYLSNISHRIKNPLSNLTSTGTMIQEAGYVAGEQLLDVFHTEPELEWMQKLQLAPQENAVILKRLRSASGQPVALTWDIFPEKLVGKSMDQGIDTAIFHHLETRCGIWVHSALTEIMALDSSNLYDKAAVETLGPQTLLLKQVHFDEKTTPVLFSYTYYRTDLIQLTVYRERKEF